MGNTFFEMHQSPEQYDEVYDKWLRLSREEQEALNVPKSRIYVSVEDIETLQDGLQEIIDSAVEYGRNVPNERRLMQMGYVLEEIKHKLKKRTKNGS